MSILLNIQLRNYNIGILKVIHINDGIKTVHIKLYNPAYNAETQFRYNQKNIILFIMSH